MMWSASFLFTAVTVGVPAAALECESAWGYNLFCLFMTFGAFDMLCAHFDKLFSNGALFAFKFIHRHAYNPRVYLFCCILIIN